ncbi:natural killer cells antigen CD94-like [Ambystoma mexicanum]|uniref:natural killer cells antigen CD94-like n=1 Tax=Ambystoma mexicanum TaxID=8296 RepID=UPI0037E8DF3A
MEAEDAYSELNPGAKDEEEDAYTELNLGLREDEETYTTLCIEGPQKGQAGGGRGSYEAWPQRDFSRGVACSPLSMCLGVMVLILFLTVVAQSVLMFQFFNTSPMTLAPDIARTPSPASNESTQSVTEKRYRDLALALEKLKEHLCVEPSGGTDSTCRICPNTWTQTKEWCYYISTDKQTWNYSNEYCSARNSNLATLDSKNEMTLMLQKEQISEYYWIGLLYSEAEEGLVWLNGSLLKPDSFTVQKRNSHEYNCTALGNNEIYLEECGSQKRWICEKRVFSFNP